MTSEELNIQERKWLAEILNNHPEAMYEKPKEVWETSADVKPIFYTNHMYSVEKDIINSKSINDNIRQKTKELSSTNLINPITSVAMNLNAVIRPSDMQDIGISLTRKVQNLLSKRDINSYVITPENEGSLPIIVIDLAQDKLTTKLQSIYESDVLPELSKKGNTIIDPDGKERTPKNIVSKQIIEKFKTILERAKEAGIGETELQQLLKVAKEEFLAKQKGGKQ